MSTTHLISDSIQEVLVSLPEAAKPRHYCSIEKTKEGKYLTPNSTNLIWQPKFLVTKTDSPKHESDLLSNNYLSGCGKILMSNI